MKKYLFMLLAAVAMISTCAVFTSCGDDDDESGAADNTLMVGKWSYVDDSMYPITTTRTYTFTSDGKFSYAAVDSYADSSLDPDITKTYSGTYTYSPSKKELTMTITDGESMTVSVNTSTPSFSISSWTFKKEK